MYLVQGATPDPPPGSPAVRPAGSAAASGAGAGSGGDGADADDRRGAGDAPTSDFVDCYQLHYPRLVRALRLAGADASSAEDSAQEAFARALVHWGRVRRGTNPAGYVYTAGFRLLARSRRREMRSDGKQADAGTSPSPADTESSVVSSLAVHAALAAMPPRRRACAVMCLVVGLPPSEAGEALGIADGTVRKHLEEARRDLAAALGG